MLTWILIHFLWGRIQDPFRIKIKWTLRINDDNKNNNFTINLSSFEIWFELSFIIEELQWLPERLGTNLQLVRRLYDRILQIWLEKQKNRPSPANSKMGSALIVRLKLREIYM